MITLVAATNRAGSRSLQLAKHYQQVLEQAESPVALFSLADFASWQRDEAFKAQEAKYLLPANKFIFILPEYNGSIPGVFKLMLDVSDIKPCYQHKKVLLVGLSTGRSGNLRGLDLMTNMAHYLQMHVFYNKLPISGIQHLMDAEGQIHDAALVQSIQQQVHDFNSF